MKPSKIKLAQAAAQGQGERLDKAYLLASTVYLELGESDARVFH